MPKISIPRLKCRRMRLLESFLLQHPLIGNVSVVGLPDERHVEAITAFVVVKEEVRVVEGESNE